MEFNTQDFNEQSSSKFELTQEQKHIVELVKTGLDLKVNAYAGSGKTTILKEIGSTLSHQSGLYLAFNKVTATQAQKIFPLNVECRTAHSLAYAAVGHQYRDRLNRLTGRDVANKYLDLSKGLYTLPSALTGNLILDAVRRFTYSKDTKLSWHHVPKRDLAIVFPDDTKTIKALRVELATYAQKIWDRMADRSESIPITHDVYLKLWQLSSPNITKDFILFDEAQDASPVMMDIVQQQSSQTIWVGDHYQSIYQFRGSVNAMDEIEKNQAGCDQKINVASITQSFRFGQPIADVANTILNGYTPMIEGGEPVPIAIQGFEKIQSQTGAGHEISQPNVILFRTNKGLINKLVSCVERSQAVHVAGGCRDLIYLLQSAQELMDKGRTSHRELCLFSDWAALVEYSETESGRDLKNLVNLVMEHGTRFLIPLLRKAEHIREEEADIILSTAHKSKGREWAKVKLGHDFPTQTKDEDGELKPLEESEVNLIYVAATRAINELDFTDCEAITSQYEQTKPTLDEEGED